MYRITKGEFTIQCDTEAELRIAAAVLDYVTPPVEGVPSWRVGGPSGDCALGTPELGSTVDDMPSGSSVSGDIAVAHPPLGVDTIQDQYTRAEAAHKQQKGGKV